MLEQKREEATAVLLMMMIDDEDDKEWKSQGREVGSRSVKIVNWEEERVVSVNNNVFPPGGQQISQACQLGGGEGGQCQQQCFFHQVGSRSVKIVNWEGGMLVGHIT